jgi:hypothetical protein
MANRWDDLGIPTHSLAGDLLSTFIFNYRVIQKKYATGKPDQKDLNENLAAAQGLAHMITECNRLFEVRSWNQGQAGKQRMLVSLLFAL